MFKPVLFACVLLVCAVASPVQKKSPAPLELVNFISLQEPCVRQGGICMPISECTSGNLVQTDIRGILCPLMSIPDIECCYDV